LYPKELGIKNPHVARNVRKQAGQRIALLGAVIVPYIQCELL
jgi:hypothetical protein